MYLSHINRVPVSKTQIEKYCSLFLTAPVSSLSFDAVVWICVSRGNAVAISFPSHKGSGQLPLSLPVSRELSKRNANICLAWFLLKWHQIGFSEGWGLWIVCSAVPRGSLKHWGPVCLTCESKTSNEQPEV